MCERWTHTLLSKEKQVRMLNPNVHWQRLPFFVCNRKASLLEEEALCMHTALADQRQLLHHPALKSFVCVWLQVRSLHFASTTRL